MGDENGVIVMERSIADAAARDMANGIVAGELYNGLVAGQAAVHCQREALEIAFRAEPRKQVRGRKTIMVLALRTDMMARAIIGDVNLHHLVETRCGWAVFQDGDRGAFFHPHEMTDHDIRPVFAVKIS